MHHANHFYGHAHIMARYVGLEHPPRIWGYLQHGWNMHDGFAVGTVFAEGYPKYVWSQACVRRGHAAGLRDYQVVAAPWLYLLRLEAQREWHASAPAREREGTIVYPFHGWEGQQIVGDHVKFIDEIREAEGDVPLTFCLQWNEYDNPKVRSQYEDAGVRVVTHGQRGYLWKDTEPAFLYRQLDEMRRHKRVVSNRMSSAIMYAAAAGNEVGVYGDPMALEMDHAILGGVGKPRRLWPEMHQFAVPRAYAEEVAASELGLDEMLSPQEVLDVFRWTPELPGGKPRTPPPAPPLEDEESFWSRRRRRRAAHNSHLAPAVAERFGGLAPVGSTLSDLFDDDGRADAGKRPSDPDARRAGDKDTDGDERSNADTAEVATAPTGSATDGDVPPDADTIAPA
jgi:hypothetical protein